MHPHLLREITMTSLIVSFPPLPLFTSSLKHTQISRCLKSQLQIVCLGTHPEARNRVRACMGETLVVDSFRWGRNMECKRALDNAASRLNQKSQGWYTPEDRRL